MSFNKLMEQLKAGRGRGNWGHSGRPGMVGGSTTGGAGMGSDHPNAAAYAAAAKVTELKKLGWHNANHMGGTNESEGTIYASYRPTGGRRTVGVVASVAVSGKISNVRVGTITPTTKSGQVDNPKPLKSLPTPERAVNVVGDQSKPWFKD